jgi:replicative DNA helicase
MNDDFDTDLIDENVTEKYNWDRRYQQEIVGMMLNDKMFLIQCMQLVKPSYFHDQAHELICSSLFDYFTAYSQIPARFVLADLIRSQVNKDDSLVIRCMKELDICADAWTPGQESREHCLDRVTDFGKEQSLRLAVWQTVNLLKKRPKQPDRWIQIEKLLKDAILVDRNYDIGQNYFDTLDARYDRMMAQGEVEVFSTGFDEIDLMISRGGLKRGEVGAYMGLSGTGKSVMLVKSAVRNIVRGKKVLYLSLEMSEDGIARRFDSQLARMDMRNLINNRDSVIKSVKEYVSEDIDKRKLVIKQFAAGTLDMPALRAYVSQLRLQGFTPDVICLDYVGELKDYENVKVYESRQRLVRELRGLAMEEKICIMTALQANRRGREQVQSTGVMDDDALGDSYGQARPLDLIISINIGTQDKEGGIGQLFVVKNRDGESRKTIYIKKEDDCLDFKVITTQEYQMIYQKASSKLTEDVESQVSKIVGGKKKDRGPENS